MLTKRTAINCVETRRSKSIVKYIIYRIVDLLLLTEFLNQFTIHGMNMKVGQELCLTSTHPNDLQGLNADSNKSSGLLNPSAHSKL
jgi:hypothetical protein